MLSVCLLVLSVALNLWLMRALRKSRQQFRSAEYMRSNYKRWYENIGDANANLYKELVAARCRLKRISRDAGAEPAGTVIKAGKIAAALLVALLCCASAQAQQVSPPPEDGGRPFLVVITHKAPSPQEKLLLDNIARDESLAAIRSQCHFTHYDNENPLYAQRYAKAFGQARLPVVMLQRSDGGVLYLATGENVPAGARDLFDEMAYYASLDPTRSNQDSRAYHGAPSRPCPNCPPDNPDCDGDSCPIVPGVPSFDPSQPPGGGGLQLPDSAELLRRTTKPARDAAAVGVYLLIGGGLLVLFVGLCFVGGITLWLINRTPRR